jgi:hypothetical protein
MLQKALRLGEVSQACNLSYSEGRDMEKCGSRSVLQTVHETLFHPMVEHGGVCLPFQVHGEHSPGQLEHIAALYV